MFEGFKKFIARGNMIDMAVGVVMGGAVTTVVNAIVNSVINPFIAMVCWRSHSTARPFRSAQCWALF